MKWCYMVLIFPMASICFGQKGNSLTSIDTAQINKLLASSRSLQWIDAYRSLDLADKALEGARNIKYKKGIATANNLRGFCYWSFGDNDLAIAAGMEALSIGEQENDIDVLAESYYLLARGYMDIHERSKSNEYIVKAERTAKQSGSGELRCSILNLKGCDQIHRSAGRQRVVLLS